MRDYELVWVIEGEVIYEREGVGFACPGESMVMCVPEHEKFFRWDTCKLARHAFFHFDVSVELPGLSGVRVGNGWPVVRACGEGDVIRPMFRHLLKWFENGRRVNAGEVELILATVKAMVCAFVLGREETLGMGRVVGEAWPAAVGRVVELVRRRRETDARRPIGLGEMAKAGGVSAEHLCRLFRKHPGRSPAETVRLARLDLAAGLLGRSN